MPKTKNSNLKKVEKKKPKKHSNNYSTKLQQTSTTISMLQFRSFIKVHTKNYEYESHVPIPHGISLCDLGVRCADLKKK